MLSHSEIPLLGMPLDAISHREVIRGSGTAIFGTNASAGVINVITKHTEVSVAEVSFGSNQKVKGGGSVFHQSSDSLFFFGGLAWVYLNEV